MKAILLGFLVSLAGQGLALAQGKVSPGNLSTIQTGASELTEVEAPQEVARVRIPLRLTHFEAITVAAREGGKRMEYKPLAPMTYHLRATVNRSNHFYLSDWHIESVPMKWQKASKQWEVELKFYKRYGQEQELEEFIGNLPLKGRLMGGEMLFTFDTQAKHTFMSKRSTPVLTVEAGTTALEKAPIARRDLK